MARQRGSASRQLLLLVSLIGVDGMRDEDADAEQADHCRCDLDHCIRP